MIEDKALDERLTKLIEECSEIIQIASKIKLWGFDSYHPRDESQTTNRTLLEHEIGDLIVILELMYPSGDISYDNVHDRIIVKTKKINKYLQHNKVKNV